MRNKYRFLVVDDMPDELSEVVCIIKEGGQSVVGATNLGDALKILATETIDVLITDLHLTEENPLEAAKPVGTSALHTT